MDYEKIILEWKNFEIPEIFNRNYSLNINHDLISTISGPRRAGKTYFCFQLIKKLSKEKIPIGNILYINFEDEKLINADSSDLDNLFQKYLEIFQIDDNSKIFLFFDEIQNVKNWSNWIRRIYDTKKNIRIVLTGSSSKLLSKEISTNLRGRTFNLEVLPFSFREFLNLEKISFYNKVDSFKNENKIKNKFKEYLSLGGYPFTTINKNFDRDKILQEYYNSMIFHDVVERYKIKDVKKLQLIARLFFESVSKEVSYNKISNKLKSIGFDITRNTVQEYISYLEEAYLFFQVLKYEYSLSKQIGSIKKIYCIDNGILNSLTFKFSEDYGKLLENLVFLELYRRGKKVFYNRDRYECDFVIQEKTKIVEAIQICYKLDDASRKREVEGIVEAMNKFKLEEGLILTYNQEEEISIDKKKIFIRPVWKWLLNNSF